MYIRLLAALLSVCLLKVHGQIHFDTLFSKDLSGLTVPGYECHTISERILGLKRTTGNQRLLLFDTDDGTVIDSISDLEVDYILGYGDTLFLFGREFNQSSPSGEISKARICRYLSGEFTRLGDANLSLQTAMSTEFRQVYQSREQYYIDCGNKYLRLDAHNSFAPKVLPGFPYESSFIVRDTLYHLSTEGKIEIIPLRNNDSFDIYGEWSLEEDLESILPLNDTVWVGFTGYDDGRIYRYRREDKQLIKMHPVKNCGKITSIHLVDSSILMQKFLGAGNNYYECTFYSIPSLNRIDSVQFRRAYGLNDDLLRTRFLGNRMYTIDNGGILHAIQISDNNVNVVNRSQLDPFRLTRTSPDESRPPVDAGLFLTNGRTVVSSRCGANEAQANRLAPAVYVRSVRGREFESALHKQVRFE